MRYLVISLCVVTLAVLTATQQTCALKKDKGLHKCGNNLRSFERGRRPNQVSICEALELYAIDNNGQYPKRLAVLKPKYLRTIPTCPAASKDTYSSGYQSTARQYTVFCSGNHHPTTSPNYPNATSLRNGDPVRLGPGQPARYIWTRDRGLIPNPITR